MTGRQRAVLLALAALVLVGALVLAGSSGDDGDEKTTSTAAPSSTTTGETTSAATTTPTATTDATPPAEEIRLRGGKPVGGVAELDFDKGERIRIVVRSDVADELHLHGYDVTRDVAPGKPARFSVEATIDGRFELETHHGGVQVAEISVNP